MTAVPGTAGRLADLYGLTAQPLYGPAGATVYDMVSRNDPEEISDVLRLAYGAVGPVLELGCGTGRLTLPLVARGKEVVALDNSPALLAILNARLQDDGPRVVEADMTRFAFDQSFGLIVLAASSVCLLDAEQRASTFRCVREHLGSDGVFYVSVLDLADTLVSRARPAERVNVMVTDNSVLTLHQYFNGRHKKRTTSLLHEAVDKRVTVDRAMYISDVNIVSSAELSDELDAAGLEVIERKRGPDGEQVEVQLICRRAGVADE